MQLDSLSFEQGPIRPPSEAGSLLVRLTRNCPWGKCLFCPVYKGQKFSRRGVEEIKQDIHAMAEGVRMIKNKSFTAGYGGRVNRQVAAMAQAEHPDLAQLAFWLYQGGETVFLQDGDSLLLPTDQFVEVLELLREQFPAIKRITTYARSRTLLRRSVEELVRLKKAGLNRIHTGLESGDDEVLAFMRKGVTGEQHVEGGLRVKAAGISLSEYVILGLGGEKWSRRHALHTAEVLNRINPDFIRLRTLVVHPSGPLAEKVREGAFKPLGDDDIVREEALLIRNLEGIESSFYSDHIINLLEEVKGKLPGDKKAMLAVIERYLALPDEERECFRLGRRTGFYRYLDDALDPKIRNAVQRNYDQLKQKGLTVDEYIEQAMLQFI